jgi:DNA-binding beta-propeller fold protein YncE
MAGRWALLLLLLVSACTTSVPAPPHAANDEPPLVWPEAPEPPRIGYIRQFSSPQDLGLRESFSHKLRGILAGKDDQGMLRPYAISVGEGRVAVADPGATFVHLFDTDRKSYRKLDSAGDNRFVTPIGVLFAGERLWIADSGLNRVFILDRRFKLLHTIDDLKRPTGLAYDPDRQRIYVADTLAHDVKVFDQAGKQLTTIGGRGEGDGRFNYPSHLVFANGHLLVNDTMNSRIQVFDSAGRYLDTFGKSGTGSGYFARTKGVAVDSEGHIYIADALSNQVQIFDQEGKFLLGFGSAGDGPGQFSMPAGLAIWNDMIYVADSLNHRVQIFRYLREEH